MKIYNYLAVKSFVIAICSITNANHLNTSISQGSHYYEVKYSLVDHESGELKEMEQGKLKENIELTKEANKFRIIYTYIVEKVNGEEIIGDQHKPQESTLLVTRNSQLLSNGATSTNNASSLVLGFYINNFRYGFYSNPSPNIELGSEWNTTLIDNQWTYKKDFDIKLLYSSFGTFNAEYHVNTIKECFGNKDLLVDQYRIEWKSIRGFWGSWSHWSNYGNRHGDMIIDGNGDLQELTVYTPKAIQGFKASSLLESPETKVCLIIKKIDKSTGIKKKFK